MKRFCGFILMAAATILTSLSCSEEEAAVEYLEVNVNNISGTWQASEWQGQPLVDGSYVYVNFIRKGAKFELYQNLDSFTAHKLTGTFNITTDESLGSVIMGMYDYDSGYWAHDYIITKLTSSSMVWAAVNDDTDITIYERVDSIPVAEE